MAKWPAQTTALFVLRQLIEEDDQGSFVWLADQSRGVAKKAHVEIVSGMSNGLVQVTGGIAEGSRVISVGKEGIRDGDRIQVTGEDETLGTGSEFRSSKPDDG